MNETDKHGARRIITSMAFALPLTLLLTEPALAAGGLNDIPPKRLLLIFPVIVLAIIGVLLIRTRRR